MKRLRLYLIVPLLAGIAVFAGAIPAFGAGNARLSALIITNTVRG